MFKKKIYLLIIFVVILCSIYGINYINSHKEEDNNDLRVIKVAEVAHSVFYAPQYVAMSLGYFEEYGIQVDLTLANGADNVMAAVLSGDVDIGLSGSEATIYVYNGNEKDYIMTFAGLTQKDGSFLVSRYKIDNFTLDDLVGKSVLGGRVGGMPLMTFEWALKEHGIDKEKDLFIDTSVAFAAMEGAFIGGNGDFVTLFEPNATNVEKNGYGYVVGYVGDYGGVVPYTAYNAKRSFILNNKDIISGFSSAINKGLSYVYDNESSVVASLLIDYFPDTDIDTLTMIVDRYKAGDAWKHNINISEEEWIHIQDIVDNSIGLDNYVKYDDLIYSEFFSE